MKLFDALSLSFFLFSRVITFALWLFLPFNSLNFDLYHITTFVLIYITFFIFIKFPSHNYLLKNA